MSHPTIKPLADRVLVEIDYTAERTLASGIVIPEATKKAPQRGRILAVGPGRTLDDGTVVPVALTVGDVVIYAQHAGTPIEHYGEGDEIKMSLFREFDILAVANDA